MFLGQPACSLVTILTELQRLTYFKIFCNKFRVSGTFKNLDKCQSKANPCTGLLEALRFSGGWSSQIWRKSAHEGRKVVSPMYRYPLPPRKYPWYSFLLEAESTPGPQCGRKDYFNEKVQWHCRESNPRSTSINYAIACPQNHMAVVRIFWSQ